MYIGGNDALKNFQDLLDSFAPMKSFESFVPGDPLWGKETPYDNFLEIEAMVETFKPMERLVAYAPVGQEFPVQSILPLAEGLATFGTMTLSDYKPKELTLQLLPDDGSLSGLLDHMPTQFVPSIKHTIDVNKKATDMVAIADFLASTLTLMVFNVKLYQYNGAYWVLLDKHACIVMLQTMARAYDWYTAFGSREYSELMNLLISHPAIQCDQPFPSHEHYINFSDGTLNLDTMVLQPHCPDDGFFNCLDIAYADSLHATGDIFEGFIACASDGNPLVRKQVLQLMLLALTGIQCKTFFAIIGPSGTGKSQLGRLIASLLGENQVTNIRGMRDFGDKFALADIDSKRVILCMDLDDSVLPDAAVGMMKQLVGDDGIRAEPKFKSHMTVYQKPLFVCAGNHPIRLKNMAKEDAWLKRMVIIPFMGVADEQVQIHELYQVLMRESGYIVQQAIAEYADFIADGCHPVRSDVPDMYQVREGHSGYDTIRLFWQICCHADSSASISLVMLYEQYCLFCQEEPLSKPEFSRYFKRIVDSSSTTISYQKYAVGSQRGYKGLVVQIPDCN